MLKAVYYSFLLLFLIPLQAVSQTADNDELKQMYSQDQRARIGSDIDWPTVLRSDSMRERRVYELMAADKVVTAKDHFHAALIFQHGRDSVAYGMAVMHMRKAIALDSSIYRWLLAAAIDRELWSRDKPQVYGTQYMKIGPNGKWELYKIDTTHATDAERRHYGVETLAEQKIKTHNMNLRPLSAYKAQSAAELIKFVKAEKAKGNRSEYNVSKDGLDTYGYQLIAAGRNEEAVSVFKLNTVYHPTSASCFDNYGEVLLKLNRRGEGLRAYQRSLELNPKNEHARKILSRNR